MSPYIHRDYAPRWYVPRLSIRAIVEALLVLALDVVLTVEVLP